MSKYSFEFKKKVVKAYLNGEGGYGYLSKTYGVPAQRNIEEWVHNYQKFGDEGLIRSRKNQTYSFEKKLSVVELYLSSEISYQDLALQEGITNPSMIVNWVNRLLCFIMYHQLQKQNYRHRSMKTEQMVCGKSKRL